MSFLLLLGLAACTPPAGGKEGVVAGVPGTNHSIHYRDVKIGRGAEVPPDAMVNVRYSAWDRSMPFDFDVFADLDTGTARVRERTLAFPIGSGANGKGIDGALIPGAPGAPMQVGGVRLVAMPREIAGAAWDGEKELAVFRIEVLEIL